MTIVRERCVSRFAAAALLLERCSQCTNELRYLALGRDTHDRQDKDLRRLRAPADLATGALEHAAGASQCAERLRDVAPPVGVTGERARCARRIGR